MRINFFSLVRVLCTHVALLLALSISVSSKALAQAAIPFTLSNNSAYTDANIYVAVVGIINGTHIWINPKTGAINQMSPSYNTVQGPVYNGDQGPGGNGKYAACFTKLSEIPNKTLNIPGIAGCRILISFNSQLYLYFFGATGAPSGFSAPNLANPNDPNQGIRFETVELSNAPNGLWVNTSRVDCYQYPMGLEVWGNNGFYQKVGEYVPHSTILSQWQATAPAEFQSCYNATNGIIQFPSKTAAWQTGAQSNYFGSYIDAIWSKYTSGNLVFNSGDAGIWSGRITNGVFTFTRSSDGAVGTIARKPTQTEALEGSGVMAAGGENDQIVQKMLCAAINRHVLNLNLATGATQDFSTPSAYYQTTPYNWYAKFWHRTDITLNGYSYGFCYDDVFNQSSTVNAPSATKVNVLIGGFAGVSNSGVATMYKDCNYGGYAVALQPGSYTMSQLNALGILNDDISSLKVTAGYKVTLYENDNFTGTSLVVTADDDCLVDNGWNDKATSLKVETNTTSTSIVIQAENYTYMSGVQLETTTDAGGGQSVGYIDAGDWMSYDVTIPATGTYNVNYRVAATAAGNTLRLEKDAGATNLGTVTIPNTGGWQTWGNVSHNVSLPAGTYSIGIATATGGFNINYFTITNTATGRIAAVQRTVSEDKTVVVSPNPVAEQLYIRNSELVKVLSIYDLSGHKVRSVVNPGSNISVSTLTPGVYIIAIERKDGSQKKVKILKQ